MRPLTLDFASNWSKTTAILNPVSVKGDAPLIKLSYELAFAGIELLLDPQFFDPSANKTNLPEYKYWPKSYDPAHFFTSPKLHEMLKDLLELNDRTNVSKYIFPGTTCNQVDDEWLQNQLEIITEATNIAGKGKNRLATIHISTQVIRAKEELEYLLNELIKWDIDGYYVIAEHPKPDLVIVEDETWLINFLYFCGGLKTNGKEVVVGYGGPQQLCFVAAGVDALATGPAKTCKSLDIKKKFYKPLKKGGGSSGPLYFCSRTLSEYSLEYLDTLDTKTLNLLKPDPSHQSNYANNLFTSNKPST